MNKILFISFLSILLFNAFIPSSQSNLSLSPLNAGEKVYEINQVIGENVNHKKAEYSFPTGTEANLYFKYQYDASSFPSSPITTFRIEFDSYSSDISNYKIFCTNVPSDTQDSSLITTLDGITEANSACTDGFKSEGFYDGIVKLNTQSALLGIVIKESKSSLTFTGRVNLRIKERILEPSELKPNEDETYTLVPYVITLQKFRDAGASKVLFYSYYRNLEMFYTSTTPNPSKLFGGNVLSVYTNPNMIMGQVP